MAGDLFVHLFSGTNFVTGTNGPTQGMATGAIRYWKDGRDADDVVLGLFDYREGFNLSLRVNFVDGGEESESLIFTGDEGTMEIGWTWLAVNRVPREKEPGLTIDTFPKAMQAQIEADYAKKYPRGILRARRRWATRNTSLPPGIQRPVRPLQEFLRARCVRAGRRWRMQCSDIALRARRC